MTAKAKISVWPSYMLGALATAWLLQEAGLLELEMPLGPIAMIWACLCMLLLIKQTRGN